MHMADPHLPEGDAIGRGVDAIIVFPPAETVPHGFCSSVYGSCCPVGKAVIGDNASQMLVSFSFILYGGFQPVFAVQIHYDAALIKPLMAGSKISFYKKAEIFFCRFYLEKRGIVILEMVICSLP